MIFCLWCAAICNKHMYARSQNKTSEKDIIRRNIDNNSTHYEVNNLVNIRINNGCKRWADKR